MPVDPAFIGTELPNLIVDIESGRLRLFAKSIGETDPVYADKSAARAAGHRDLPVPPTFLMALEREQNDALGYLTEMGVDLRHVLHGEQAFTYHRMAYAGDRLSVHRRIADVYTKRNGTLEFIVKDTTIGRADGTPIADLRSVFVVRNPAGAG